jgi:hypothetical protein
MTTAIAPGTPAATDPSAVQTPPAAPVAAPVATPTPVVAPAPVQPAAAAPPVAPTSDPGWLKARLDSAKASGDREATARYQAELDVLRATKTRADQLEAAVTSRATREMGTLNTAQQAAVKAIAGDDPARQLQTIDALAPTWAAAPAAPVTPRATPPAPPIPAPANSGPANPAPPAPNPNPQSNVLATYQELEQRNPMLAANYYLAHRAEITAAQGRTP